MQKAADPMVQIVFRQFIQGRVSLYCTDSGSTAPKRTFTNVNIGDVYKSQALNLVNDEIVMVSGKAGVGRVLTFPRLASGAVSPTRTITGASTNLSDFQYGMSIG
jgi:hypothetical protein